MAPPSHYPREPQHWLDWLLRAEAALDALDDGDDYALYELIHRTAALIARVDVCYVCLHRPHDDMLFFSYKFNGELYEEPSIVPLGDGPTSWVVREEKPFVLSSENEHIHRESASSNEDCRVSLSAIHLPIVVPEPCGRKELIGVFSVQSYLANVYSEATVAVMQLWCNRVALHLHLRRTCRAHSAELHEMKATLRASYAHQICMADHFVELVQPVSRQSHGLLETLNQDGPLSRADLRLQVEALRRSSYRLQTEASQLPLTARLVAPSAHGLCVVASDPNPLHLLTPRELEILHLLATGAINSQVALVIGRSVDTVKKHCAGIYRKLGVRNRTEATRIYAHYTIAVNNQTGKLKQP